MAIDGIGAFEVIERLGEGAGSSILKIRRQADAKVYALKVVVIQSSEDKKFVDQVEREYEIASALDHRALIKAYAFEKTHKLLFLLSGARLLMEYFDSVALDRCPKLPIGKLVAIYAQAADGLVYMHKHKIYHADLKPANILVGSRGGVKIIDFGLAWKEGEAKGRVQGTLEFLAPEQANDKVVNARTDIFNLGACMYRSITGMPIPAQLRDRSTGVKRLDELVRPMCQGNADIPESLDELVRSCIKVNPARRPASACEVRDALRKIADDLGVPVKARESEDE